MSLFRLLILIGCVFCAVLSQSQGAARLANAVLAVVNDAVITQRDLDKILAREIDFLKLRYGSQPEALEKKLEELAQQQLEELVERELILHEFKTAGYNLPESYIESKINEDIREHGGRLNLTKTLQQDGLTSEAYRKKVRDRIIIDAMVQFNIAQEIIVSPLKIENYYKENLDKFKLEDQVKLRMIVIPKRATDTFFSPRKLADEILAKLNQSAPFEEMARIYSLGSQSRQGGDWGWVERSILRPDLGDIAFSLKPGERTGVIDADDACYIMLVEDTRKAHVKPLADVRSEIEAALKGQEHKRLRKKWIDKLKAKSYLRYY